MKIQNWLSGCLLIGMSIALHRHACSWHITLSPCYFNVEYPCSATSFAEKVYFQHQGASAVISIRQGYSWARMFDPILLNSMPLHEVQWYTVHIAINL